MNARKLAAKKDSLLGGQRKNTASRPFWETDGNGRIVSLCGQLVLASTQREAFYDIAAPNRFPR